MCDPPCLFFYEKLFGDVFFLLDLLAILIDFQYINYTLLRFDNFNDLREKLKARLMPS